MVCLSPSLYSTPRNGLRLLPGESQRDNVTISPQSVEYFPSLARATDVADALLRVFGNVDTLVVEACVLRGSSLAHHLSAMRRILDKVRSQIEKPARVHW